MVLDKIHRAPSSFSALRGFIDEGPRAGYGSGRFLVPGSASIDLLQQSGESLAGRISCVGHPDRRIAARRSDVTSAVADLLWAIEIKRSLEGRPEKAFYNACQDLKSRFVEKRR